jgi:ATP-binding cassette subfamily F protein 3
VVIVSHDRYFLNRMVTAIADLAGGSVTLYHGDYDHFLVEREARQALREARARNQAKRVAEIERFIDRFRYKASKARQVQSRVKMLDRMERIETEAGARRIHFSFPQPPRTGRLVARLAGVRKAYGDNVVYSGVDFLVERGDRVALVGVNGAGKSTLLKVLAGALPFDAGERALGSHVEVQYYAQHQLDLLDPTRTVLEEIELAAPDAQTSRLRTILGSFLFSGDTVEKKVAVLSGGEKARLALAKMLARPAALLCMDEPTNHLDLASKEVLEEALSGFTGTIVFISHDRYFINRIATQVVEVDHGHLTTHLGTYDDYLDHKAAATASPAAAEPTRSPAPKPASKDQSKDQTTARQSRASAAEGSAGAISGPPQMKGLKKQTEATTTPNKATGRKPHKNLDREIKAIKARLGTVEAQIHEMEARLQEIGLALADPDLYRDGDRARDIAQARRDTEERVAWLMKEWEDLSVRLSTVSAEGS